MKKRKKKRKKKSATEIEKQKYKKTEPEKFEAIGEIVARGNHERTAGTKQTASISLGRCKP